LEDVADDDETKGKSSAWSKGVSVREESLNGRRSRQLTDGEGQRQLTSALGKTSAKCE
jgi:hypothetical protein